MNKVFGFVILFAAAWLMYRLQAHSGSCCGTGYEAAHAEGRQDHNGCREKEVGEPPQEDAQRAVAASNITGTPN